MIRNKHNILNVSSYLFCLLWAVIIVVTGTTNSQAEMKPMNNNEMEEVTAQAGFADFSVSDDTVLAMFNGLELDIKAEFDSWRWGHWNNGNGIGWDNKWPGVTLHSDGFIGIGEADPMQFRRFFIEAGFDNVDSPDRKLNYVQFGFKEADGLLDPDDFEKASMVADGDPVFHREHVQEALFIDINKLDFDNDSFTVRIQLREGPHEESGINIPKGIWAESDAGKYDLGIDL